MGVSFCFQAEDGIRDLVRSRGLGDVYKRQPAERGEQQTDGRCRLRRSGSVELAGGEPDEQGGELSLIHI